MTAFSVVRVRLTAFQLTSTCRRPPPERVEDIGLWADAVSAICSLSVLSNTAIFVFTANQLQDLDWRLRVIIYVSCVRPDARQQEIETPLTTPNFIAPLPRHTHAHNYIIVRQIDEIVMHP